MHLQTPCAPAVADWNVATECYSAYKMQIHLNGQMSWLMSALQVRLYHTVPFVSLHIFSYWRPTWVSVRTCPNPDDDCWQNYTFLWLWLRYIVQTAKMPLDSRLLLWDTFLERKIKRAVNKFLTDWGPFWSIREEVRHKTLLGCSGIMLQLASISFRVEESLVSVSCTRLFCNYDEVSLSNCFDWLVVFKCESLRPEGLQ